MGIYITCNPKAMRRIIEGRNFLKPLNLPMLRAQSVALIIFRLRSVSDMVGLWLMCMFALGTIVTGKLYPTVSGSNYGLQPMSDNGTGCDGVPHGDPLKHLCDPWQGVTCCLYRNKVCGAGLCLHIEGGNDIFLRMLFPHLPTHNITTLFLITQYLSYQQAAESWCILTNLTSVWVTSLREQVQGFACLSHLRELIINSDDQFSVTNTTFRGLNHLLSLYINFEISSLLTDGMMQLQDAKKLNTLSIVVDYDYPVVQDAWPLCLAQKHPGIRIYLTLNRVTNFINTLSPSRCDTRRPLLKKACIVLSTNTIMHVSDIATGWGFSSIHHFITSLMRENSTEFPIKLDRDENLFNCDCIDLDLYRILRDPRYNKHLSNLANLTCAGPPKLKGRLFGTLLDSELDCDSPPLSLILGVSVGGILVLSVSVLGLLFYNRIRLYRWSGLRLHPWDRDECIGEHKEFDVFVSHASEDEQWTLELIEELECLGFKVLFHKRDFELGVTKIENIMMAVDKSKRTICVLSPSFVASPWCSWEFITVYNDDIEEHQRRLLLIVKERVAWESLSLAMQRYMRDFTYINAESPYFMDNLLYSLPVKRLGEAREATETGVGRDCQPATSDATSDTGPDPAGERTPLLQAV